MGWKLNLFRKVLWVTLRKIFIEDEVKSFLGVILIYWLLKIDGKLSENLIQINILWSRSVKFFDKYLMENSTEIHSTPIKLSVNHTENQLNVSKMFIFQLYLWEISWRQVEKSTAGFKSQSRYLSIQIP